MRLGFAVLVVSLYAATASAYDIVRVHVVTPDKQPVAYATVTMTLMSAPSKMVMKGSGHTVITKRGGEAEFLNPMEGTYAISATAPGYRTATVDKLKVVSAVVVKPRVHEVTITLNAK